MDKELNKLYELYQSNIKVDDTPYSENISPIKVGDILVALYNNREIRGEVAAVYENYYSLKGKNGFIKVTMDDIQEHYPKNRAFENKTVKKFTEIEEPVKPKPVKTTYQQVINESAIQTPPPDQKEEKAAGKIQVKKKKVIDEEEERQQENTPDNQVDLTIEKIKTIGKLMYYKDLKYSEINSMFERKLLSKEEYWYLLTEKPNEIHVIRNNEKAFEIQPFVNALVGHFLKSTKKDSLLNESYGQIKVSGNNNFSVVTNIPDNVQKQLLNSIIALLSGIKK